MPILNKSLLLKLVILAMVLGGGLFGVHRVQADRVPKALLWQANTAAEKGKTDRAINYMRQYLEFRPDDHDNAVKLADMIYERAATSKDFTNATFLYEKVLREAPHRADVGRKLVTLNLLMGRSEDALIHAERLLKETPNDGVLLGQLAECQMLQNKPDEARKSFESAISFNPKTVRVYEQYARLLTRHFNKPQDAAGVLDRMCVSNPGLAEAFLIRARYHRTANKPAECMRDLDRVFLLDPENADALALAAEIEQMRGDVRRAKSTLAALISTHPRDGRGYRALSWLHLISGNQAEAVACLEQGTAILPEAPELLTPLADIYIDQGEIERAKVVIKKLEVRKDTKPQLKYLRGRTLMKEGLWNEALTTLDSLRGEAVAMQSLTQQLNLLIAACHERRSDKEAHMDALKRILTGDPSHLGAHVALGNAHLAAGNRESALKEYQLAARSPFAGTAVWLTYANIRLALAKDRKNPDDWRNIRTLLAEIRKQNKHVIEPLFMQAEAEAAQGNWSGAIKQMKDECLRRPEDPRLWSALANLVARGQGTVAATEVLGEAQLAVGDSVELKLARARLWLDDYFPGRAQRIGALEQTGSSEAERVRLLSGLLEIYTQLQDEAAQQRVALELAARNPQDLATRKLLYTLALRSGDGSQSKWRDELRKLEGTTGRTHAVLEALATIDAQPLPERKLSEFADLVQSVLNTKPDDLDALLLSAKLAEKRGNNALALTLYDNAFVLEPTQSKTQIAFLNFLLRTATDEQLKSTLARLTGDPRITLGKVRWSLEAALQGTPPTATVRLVNSLGEVLNREPRMMLWTGQMLERQSKYTDALAIYKAATTINPTFVDGWSARLLVAARIGDKETTETVQQAQATMPREAFITVVAECAPTVKSRLPDWVLPISKPEDKRAYAQACMLVCEARSKLDDALPVLTNFANDPQTPEADAAWAKQILTALTAAKGTAQQRREAVQQLRSGSSAVKSIDDARSRMAALMVALRTNSGDDRRVITREMIQLLEKAVQDPKATANDWFSLAQLHRMLGDRANARRSLEKMLTLEPNNLFFIAVNVDDLLSEGRIDAVRPFVPKLQEGLHDIRVAGALGRYFTLTNDAQPVFEIADRFVRTSEPGTTDRNMRERQAAELLDQLTRLANMRGLSCAKQIVVGASEHYRAALKSYPDAIVPYTALLAFDGQVKAAFEELDRYKKRLTPATTVLAGVGVLRSGFAEPAQFQMVQEWIEAALAETPTAIPMKLNLAELHTLRQDFTIAENLYRDVLKAEPKNIVALNNLAWILAPKPESADQALTYADRAIELYGASGEMLDTRARIYIAAGKCERAIADLNDAINQGQSPLRYFHLALAHYKLGQTTAAVQAFQTARARGLDSKAIHPYDLPLFKQLTEEAAKGG